METRITTIPFESHLRHCRQLNMILKNLVYIDTEDQGICVKCWRPLLEVEIEPQATAPMCAAREYMNMQTTEYLYTHKP
jgi:hypothetical protein